MYINFWYPIVKSDDLGMDTPEKAKVLGVNLVAFRDTNGKAHVLSDTCIHRGASLGGAWSMGSAPRIIDGCLVCPYHGWEFNGKGECVNIPSIGYGTKTPPRAKVDSYPVEEKYGIVFAFLGDLSEEERPPLLNVEEYGQEGWHANELLVLEVDYNYERSMENGLDPAHNEFVHPTHGHAGKYRDTYRVREYDTEDHRQGWGFWFNVTMDTPPLPQGDHETAKDGTPWGKEKTERSMIRPGGGTYGPNAMATYITLTPEKMFRQYFFEQPVTENKTRIFFLNMRNFMLDRKKDVAIHERNKIIAKQDIDILLDNKHQLLLEVSHELRSPLARMQLLIAMIPEHKNLTKLKEEVEFLEGMIGNLLFSDRLSLPYSKLDLQKFSTQDIIGKVMDMFPTNRDRVKIDNNIPDEQVYIDETKFSLALRNLLDNAFKYSKPQANADIKLTVVKNGDIEFQVKDSGIGISKDDINKITQPFFQANQTVSTKGFGLGLTICKKIIESHKGRLSIESGPEEGSIFTLHLPKI